MPKKLQGGSHSRDGRCQGDTFLARLLWLRLKRTIEQSGKRCREHLLSLAAASRASLWSIHSLHTPSDYPRQKIVSNLASALSCVSCERVTVSGIHHHPVIYTV